MTYRRLYNEDEISTEEGSELYHEFDKIVKQFLEQHSDVSARDLCCVMLSCINMETIEFIVKRKITNLKNK